MKLYELVRDEDVSGVSGTGPVAQVVEFDTGWCAVSFYYHTAGVPNVIVYDRIDAVKRIHGHGGKTRLVRRSRPTDFAGEKGWSPA